MAKRISVEQLVILHNQLSAFLPKNPARKQLVTEFAQSFGVSPSTVYRQLRHNVEFHHHYRKDFNLPRNISTDDMLMYCRLIAALKVRTSNKNNRHLSTPKCIEILEHQKHLAEQADQTMKDVYTLDLLGITGPVLEAEIERRMVAKIKDVILELGYGFSFIGNQYRIVTPDSEYFIDLLFYHRKLQALVAVELKRSKFKAEYTGKMNLYLNLLDDFVKEPHENPSIGIILCGERSRFDVEYALRDKLLGVLLCEHHCLKN